MDPDAPLSLHIATPCSARWGDMVGSARVRHCGACGLHVYNVAALTRAEVDRLIREHEGRLCVRLYQRSDGTAITKDCPVGPVMPYGLIGEPDVHLPWVGPPDGDAR